MAWRNPLSQRRLRFQWAVHNTSQNVDGITGTAKKIGGMGCDLRP